MHPHRLPELLQSPSIGRDRVPLAILKESGSGGASGSPAYLLSTRVHGHLREGPDKSLEMREKWRHVSTEMLHKKAVEKQRSKRKGRWHLDTEGGDGMEEVENAPTAALSGSSTPPRASGGGGVRRMDQWGAAALASARLRLEAVERERMARLAGIKVPLSPELLLGYCPDLFDEAPPLLPTPAVLRQQLPFEP